MNKKMNKKGMMLGDIPTVVWILVFAGVIIGVGLTVLGKLASSSAVDGLSETAVNNTITAIDDLPADWLPVIVIVAAAAIVIGLLFAAFRGAGGPR